MILKCSNYESLVENIKNNKRRIVIYGAGMIGMVIIPYLIEEYRLYDNLLYFIDSDKRKQGNTISIDNREYVIEPLEKLKRLDRNTVILITNSNFYPIVSMMDSLGELNEIEAYIIPIIQILNIPRRGTKINLKKTREPIIPKKIHYCWFSGNPMPDYLKKCMESWYKYCPDYEIIRWDENNYDFDKNLYMKQAYKAKKWGFVPDVARLDILYQYGGIYLDTDVELIKNIDDLLYQSAFAGVEKWGNINMGGCSGAIPKHPMIKKMLDYRINEQFIMDDGSYNLLTCGYYETKSLMAVGMKPCNRIQQVGDMMIYSSDFFHPYDYMSAETVVTDNTFSIHHFNGGWLDSSNMVERNKTVSNYHKVLERMQDKNCEQYKYKN